MKNLPKISIGLPDFLKSLWCQLAISYTLLAFCAMTLLMALLYGINDYKDFHTIIKPVNIVRQLAGDNLLLSQVIYENPKNDWWIKARNNILQKLINIEHTENPSVYRITNSSQPIVYIKIFDKNNNLIRNYPDILNSEIELEFSKFKNKVAQNYLTTQNKNGVNHFEIPIYGKNNEKIGLLQIIFIAKFNFWVQIRTIFSFLMNTWSSVLLLSIPIGIACGLIAAGYLKRQLKEMNYVTQSWRQGNFERRITLPKDDILMKHSQHLNIMAQDLETFFSLKQNIAINDERNRMARELHDTVKQKLFALGLQLATAKIISKNSNGECKHLLEAEIINREAQTDLMEIISQLRPVLSTQISFFEKINKISNEFKRRFALDIELIGTEFIIHNPLIEHHILRIIQEAFLNAKKHGNATKIIVSSNLDNNIAQIIISDNGIGFDINKKNQGFGIVSMQDRTKILPNGRMEITSKYNEGANVKIMWNNI